MGRIQVTNRSGATKTVEAEPGLSVMEIVRNNDFYELAAVCGGCCTCATCHVYIDPTQFDLLPPVSEDENLLLDGAEHREVNSRLSCQIKFDDSMNGLRVTIAPAE